MARRAQIPGRRRLDKAVKNGYDARSREDAALRLVKTRKVLELTGLTVDQVRDWTVRRELIKPDVPARKRGSEARFSWQTVLLLRLATVLRTRFHVELQAHRSLLLEARGVLQGVSFVALWGGALAIYDLARCELVFSFGDLNADEDAIVLRLDPHLEILSTGFEFEDAFTQLPLFPATQVSGTRAGKAGTTLVGGMRP